MMGLGGLLVASLNPCFNGLQMERKDGRVVSLSALVLILVLMDYKWNTRG